MVFTVERMVTVKNFHMSTGYPCWKHVEPRVGQCQFITQLSQYSQARRRCEDPNQGFRYFAEKKARFRGIFAGEKSKFAEKSADFAGF